MNRISSIGELPDVGRIVPFQTRYKRVEVDWNEPAVVYIHNVRDFRRQPYSKVKRPSLIRRVLKALS